MNRRILIKRLAGLVGLAAVPDLLKRVLGDEPPEFPTGTLTIKLGEPVVVNESTDVYTLWDAIAAPDGWTIRSADGRVFRHTNPPRRL